MSDRRRSRQLALQVLYQMEHGAGDDPEQAFALFAENFKAPPRLREYARFLVLGVHQKRPQIDQRLGRASRRWRVERMSRVDRNILRLACFEMFFSPQPVPPKVVINEAVELAKRFGSEESPAFVNGVLDSLLNQPEDTEPAPSPAG